MNYVGTLIKNKNKKMYLIDCFKPERCTIFWCVYFDVFVRLLRCLCTFLATAQIMSLSYFT